MIFNAARSSMDREPPEHNAAYCLVLLFSLILLSINNLIMFFIALEGLSLTLYILPTLDRTRGGAVASAKYFAFGTLGSIYILWGIANIFACGLSLNIGEFFNTINILSTADFKSWLTLNEYAQLIFIGLLIKLGAAPAHF